MNPTLYKNDGFLQEIVEHKDVGYREARICQELLSLRAAVRMTERLCGECHNGKCRTHSMLKRVMEGD